MGWKIKMCPQPLHETSVRSVWAAERWVCGLCLNSWASFINWSGNWCISSNRKPPALILMWRIHFPAVTKTQTFPQTRALFAQLTAVTSVSAWGSDSEGACPVLISPLSLCRNNGCQAALARTWHHRVSVLCLMWHACGRREGTRQSDEWKKKKGFVPEASCPLSVLISDRFCELSFCIWEDKPLFCTWFHHLTFIKIRNEMWMFHVF